MEMSVQEKIKRQILINMVGDLIELNSPDIVNRTWERAHDYEGVFSELEIIDEKNDFRCSREETGMDADYSRHYEGERVAKQLDCGTYVSWMYWHGGGKHGEPWAIDWISDAFEVYCTVQKKVVTIITYSKGKHLWL